MIGVRALRRRLGDLKWSAISRVYDVYLTSLAIVSGFKFRSYNTADTILLTGSPRSGTTWLGAVLSKAAGSAMVLEPFHLSVSGRGAAGFTWANYVHADSEWPAGERIIGRVFEGRALNGSMLRENSFAQLRRGTSLLIKEVRLNRLLPWLVRRFALRGIVLIVRHPCAVIASQMVSPLFPAYFELPPWDRLYLERELPNLLSWATGLKTEEELRALSWCLDQHAPFRASSAERERWVTVSHEKLVMEGARELQRILAALNLPASAEAVDALTENVNVQKNWSVDHSTSSVEKRLGTWRGALSREQVERILSVVEVCGITGFGRDPVPDFSAIGVRR